MTAVYQDFDIADSLAEKTYDAIEDSQKVVAGTNEVTKAVERNEADLVVIAGDVSPEEIVMHLPAMCRDREVPYTFVPEKEELGLAAGLNVQSAAVAVTSASGAEERIEEISQKAAELREAEEEE